MWIYIITIAILFFGSVFGFKAIHKKTATPDPVKAPKDTSKKYLTRAEIQKKLKTLKNSPVPQNLEMRGAMCYDMAAPPRRAEYVCPSCGKKTVYTDAMAQQVEWELPNCRLKIKKLKGLNASLDESQYCHKCSGEKKDPVLCLNILYEDAKEPHKYCGISGEDIDLLTEFVSDSNKHHDFYDAETPLKDYLERLEAMLGVKIK